MRGSTFEYHSTDPASVVAQRLQAFEHPRKRLLQTQSTKVTVKARTDGSFDFEIRAQRRTRLGDIPSIRVVGIVTTDPVTGRTIVNGQRKIGISFIGGFTAFGVAILLVVLSGKNPPIEAIIAFILLASAFIASGAYMMWRDWNDLTQAIQAAKKGGSPHTHWNRESSGEHSSEA